MTDIESVTSLTSLGNLSDFEHEEHKTGELLPEIQAALSKGLRELTDIYDLSGKPDFILTTFQCIEKALKEANLPALTDANYIPGNASTRSKTRKGKSTGYQEFTREAWFNYKEEKKKQKKENPQGAQDAAEKVQVTPQDMMSTFAKQWKALSEKDKVKYHEMADQRNNPDAGVSGSAKRVLLPKKKAGEKRTKPLSSYQYFISVTKVSSDIPSTQQMSYRAKLWAQLTAEEKAEYKARAEEAFWSENPELKEAYEQEEAENALKAEERKINLDKMQYIKPIVRPPTLGGSSPQSASPLGQTEDLKPVKPVNPVNPVNPVSPAVTKSKANLISSFIESLPNNSPLVVGKTDRSQTYTKPVVVVRPTITIKKP